MLFVALTLLSIAMAWQAEVVRTRKQCLAIMQREGVIFATQKETFPGKSVHVLSWWRRVLGDQEIGMIQFPLDYPAEKQGRTLELFPEISVFGETSTLPMPD